MTINEAVIKVREAEEACSIASARHEELRASTVTSGYALQEAERDRWEARRALISVVAGRELSYQDGADIYRLAERPDIRKIECAIYSFTDKVREFLKNHQGANNGEKFVLYEFASFLEQNQFVLGVKK